MKSLYDAYLGIEWEKNILSEERWARVQEMPDTMLWRVRGELKQELLDLLREQVAQRWAFYRNEQIRREQIFARLNSSAMMIGFARRFAPYKRADLILSDLDRLDRIVNNPIRPVQLVFAGKAHPEDNLGKAILEKSRRYVVTSGSLAGCFSWKIMTSAWPVTSCRAWMCGSIPRAAP